MTTPPSPAAGSAATTTVRRRRGSVTLTATPDGYAIDVAPDNPRSRGYAFRAPRCACEQDLRADRERRLAAATADWRERAAKAEAAGRSFAAPLTAPPEPKKLCPKFAPPKPMVAMDINLRSAYSRAPAVPGAVCAGKCRLRHCPNWGHEDKIRALFAALVAQHDSPPPKSRPLPRFANRSTGRLTESGRADHSAWLAENAPGTDDPFAARGR
ncbi:MAG: hypothetical protein FWD74_12570 [Actinomycetia bacterium]|nr:hypothetical protein [Actinomycetes bacterium]